MRAAPPRRESYQRAQSPPRSSGRAVNASRARHAPWLLLSRISPARRVVLLLVAVFDIAEVVLLSKRGIQQHDAVALTLGVIVLVLLLVFEVAEHAAALRDDELSREISEWLLPHAPPTLQGLEVAFSNRMANHVGSDYFNVFPRWTRTGGAHSHRVFIVMADVAGTGLQGALLMATFQASLRALADSSLPLHELASELNQWCWDRSLEGRHFTMAFLADLDPVTGAMDYVTAGHQPPVVARAAGRIEHLEVAGFPFGALADSEYETGSTSLQPEDTLVVFTDGVVSSVNRQREAYGEARVLRALERAGATNANETMNMLTRSWLSFCGSVRQQDDVSFVVVHRLT